MVDAQVQDVAPDGVAVADVTPLEAIGARRTASYETTLWVARIGRVGVIWLPIWAICLTTFAPMRALAASAVLSLIWKATLRRAYADASVTVWTIGAAVPAGVGALTGALLVAPVSGWVPGFHVPFIAVVELTMAAFLGSAVWETVVAGSLAARRRILLVGTEGGGAELLEDVARSPSLPFEMVGVIDDDRDTDQVAGVPMRGGVADLPAIVEALRPKIVVLANDSSRGPAFEQLIGVGHLGFAVVGVPEFYEYAFGRLPVRSLSPQWFMSLLHLYRRPYSQFSKRAFDVVVAAFGLLLVAPILPLLVLVVRRTHGPVIYRQQRLGEGVMLFTIY